MICHEAPILYGFGAELATRVTEVCWKELRTPIVRIGGQRAPIPFAPVLEAEVVPTERTIEDAVMRILSD